RRPAVVPRWHVQECAACALRAACPGPDRGALEQWGERALKAFPGPVEMDSLAPLLADPPAIPAAEAPRLGSGAELAPAAGRMTGGLSTAVEVKSSAYHVDRWFWDKMNGSIRWHVFQERFSTSTALATCRPPFAVRALFAGRAALVGFSLGDNAQIMCPM